MRNACSHIIGYQSGIQHVVFPGGVAQYARVQWQALRIVPLVVRRVGPGSWGGFEAVLQLGWINSPPGQKCMVAWGFGSPAGTPDDGVPLTASHSGEMTGVYLSSVPDYEEASSGVRAPPAP